MKENPFSKSTALEIELGPIRPPTHQVHGRAARRVRFHQQLRGRLSEAADLIFDGLQSSRHWKKEQKRKTHWIETWQKQHSDRSPREWRDRWRSPGPRCLRRSSSRRRWWRAALRVLSEFKWPFRSIEPMAIFSPVFMYQNWGHVVWSLILITIEEYRYIGPKN